MTVDERLCTIHKELDQLGDRIKSLQNRLRRGESFHDRTSPKRRRAKRREHEISLAAAKSRVHKLTLEQTELRRDPSIGNEQLDKALCAGEGWDNPVLDLVLLDHPTLLTLSTTDYQFAKAHFLFHGLLKFYAVKQEDAVTWFNQLSAVSSSRSVNPFLGLPPGREELARTLYRETGLPLHARP